MRRLLFATLIATVACGSDSTSPPATLSAGTYTLQSIAGRRLPVVLGQGSSLVIVADSLTIADDEAWSEVTAVQFTQNGQTTTDVTDNNGTWTRSGNTLTLTSVHTNTVVYSGSFSTSELDLSDGTLAYVFTK